MLRVAIVQFAPKLGLVSENIERARQLCSRLKPKTVDLVCFPEMIFTGYVFRSAPAILPFLEQPKTGPTSQFCAELARRLECYVAAGFPERLEAGNEPGVGSSAETADVVGVGANSAAVYGPDGECVTTYRKTHLYETDKTWARAGTGFATFDLPAPLHRVTLGICMDLNPQAPAWTLEGGPYELADHCLRTDSRVLLLLNAWLDSRTEPDDEQDWQTLNYWAARLGPLWTARGVGEHERTGTDHSEGADGTVVVVCNRSGEEDGVLFAGSSAVFRMDPRAGKPVLMDAPYGRREDTVRVWFV